MKNEINMEQLHEAVYTLYKKQWGLPETRVVLAQDDETGEVVGGLVSINESLRWGERGYTELDLDDPEIREVMDEVRSTVWDEWHDEVSSHLYEAVETKQITDDESDQILPNVEGDDGHGGIVTPEFAVKRTIERFVQHKEEAA